MGVITNNILPFKLKMCIFWKMNIIIIILLSTRVHKNGQNSICLWSIFFHETCTIGFRTHRAINPCQKLNFYKISRVVPFLIAGHKWCLTIWVKMIFDYMSSSLPAWAILLCDYTCMVKLLKIVPYQTLSIIIL